MKFLHSIRPINLVIIVITQLVCYHILINPFYTHSELNYSLDHDYLIYLLIFITVIICEGGYLINDLFDHESDSINQKDNKLAPKSLWNCYFFLITVGFILSVFTAHKYGNIQLTIIYVIAVSGLYFYSAVLKNLGLPGNILVSVYSSGVIAIIWFAEAKAIELMDPLLRIQIEQLLLAFIIFSFCISLIREIVKDMEDIQGDISAGYNTLPIRLGINICKKVVAFIGFIFSIGLVNWFLMELKKYKTESAIWVTTILLMTAYSIFLVYYADKKHDYTKASKLLKILMLIGLIYFIRISINRWIS